MAISQADQQVIQTVFGKTAEELSGALSSTEEVSLDLRLNGRVITQDEEKALGESKITQGKELGYKDVAKALGIELAAGEKDPNIISEKFKTTLSSTYEEKYKNATPSDELLEAAKRAQEWEDKYKKLNGTYEETTAKLTDWESKYSSLEGQIKQKELNNKILKAFPEKMKMDRDDALLITLSNLEFDGENVMRDGKVITDPVGNPEKLENIVKSFVEEKQWVKVKGMDGSDRKPNGNNLPGGMNDDQALSYIIEAGKDPMSPEGSKMFMELTRAV
jgi:hypothetical protein